jgi:hypothetical protein
MIDHGDRQDTSHATPLRPRAGNAKNFIIGQRDRVAHTLGGVAGFAFESRSQHGDRNIRRFSTSGLAADTVDDYEETAARITVESILVDRALTARIRLTGSYECIDSSHVVTLERS